MIQEKIDTSEILTECIPHQDFLDGKFLFRLPVKGIRAYIKLSCLITAGFQQTNCDTETGTSRALVYQDFLDGKFLFRLPLLKASERILN